MRYYLDQDGNVTRGIASELPVQRDVEPQLLRFEYDAVNRLVQVVTLKADTFGFAPSLLLAIELWNERDGLHSEGAFKTFSLHKIAALENA